METMRRPGTRTTLAAVLFVGGFLGATRTMDAQSTTYSGQAVAVSVNVIGIPLSISDTGPLPSNGGALFDQLASLTVPGIANVELLTATTTGGAGQTNSQASVAKASDQGGRDLHHRVGSDRERQRGLYSERRQRQREFPNRRPAREWIVRQGDRSAEPGDSAAGRLADHQ